MLKLSEACLDDEEKDALVRVIDKGYLGMGEEVRLFESELKTFLNANNSPYLACVNTGTSALHLAVQAIGVGPGDEVLVPTLTYLASFQAIAATGATPIACDVDARTGFIDIQDAKMRMSQNTKAIMPVHYASGFGDLEAVYDFAAAHKLRVIEDAAHSFGGFYQGQRVGAFAEGSRADVICFSFDGIKNLTCGEGGAVVSRDIDVITKVQDLRLLAIEKDTEKRFQGKRSFDFDVTEQGWRYHMSNLNAALGRAQLKKIDNFGERRRALFKRYGELIPKSIGLPIEIDIENCIPHPYVLILMGDGRDDLREFLQSKGIETGIHYKPNHLLSYFYKKDAAPFRVAESLWKHMITLPLHCNLTDQDINYICEMIKGFDGSQTLVEDKIKSKAV
jgi:dTDP-4-amino-4,6-dideoxygalactose transaminase